MSKQTGDLSIHTENIFPIIKKWLYSEHDIFMRELLSNAFDAIKKRKKITLKENLEDIDGLIDVTLDEKEKTITISDNGLGMDEDDIKTYINQIAFSGATDFLKQFSSDDDEKEKTDIIGHFGLGFYSAFMVAEKVEIKSLSYKKDAKPVHWSCKGDTKFTLETGDRKEVGTDIILHVGADSKDYLAEIRLDTLIKKYANFLPIKITLNGKEINDHNPIWTQAPKSLKKEDYDSFYQKLFPFQAPPLFYIHLNVDYPFRLQGILYFPKVMHEMDSSKGKLQLYCQQVFVTDNSKDILPEFLTLLQGVVDCPDFPLNVSRSALQNDPYVQKISKHIVKKVSDKLVSLHKKEFEQFANYWKDIHPFIKFGMMTNNDFYDKTKDITLFNTSSDKGLSTIEDYCNRNELKDEEGKKSIIIYSNNKEGQAHYIEMLKEDKKEVLYLDTIMDSHFIQFLEGKLENHSFQSVDAVAEKYLSEETESNKETEEKESSLGDTLKSIFQTSLGKENLDVVVKGLKSTSISAMISQEEHTKRFKSMQHMMGQVTGDGNNDFMNQHKLVLNKNNKVIQKIISLEESKKTPELKSTLCQHVYDLAKLSHEPLSAEEMQAFVKRSNELLENSLS